MAARSNPAFVIFIILLVILHLVLHVAGGLGVVAPDAMTIALLLAARRMSGSMAAVLGLCLGILTDALSLTAFGALALVNTIIGFLGARSRDLFEGDSLLFVGVYLFMGKFMRDALYMLLTRSASAEPWGTLLTATPLQAVYAAVAGMVALTLYRAASGER
jgi:rod shape-determining protein MreD